VNGLFASVSRNAQFALATPIELPDEDASIHVPRP